MSRIYGQRVNKAGEREVRLCVDEEKEKRRERQRNQIRRSKRERLQIACSSLSGERVTLAFRTSCVGDRSSMCERRKARLKICTRAAT